MVILLSASLDSDQNLQIVNPGPKVIKPKYRLKLKISSMIGCLRLSLRMKSSFITLGPDLDPNCLTLIVFSEIYCC